jgi:hypothetical protein
MKRQSRQGRDCFIDRVAVDLHVGSLPELESRRVRRMVNAEVGCSRVKAGCALDHS